jgi:sec-independent protein translocase protein TatA
MTLAFLPGGVGPFEMMVFGLIALLLFGKRLPEVARSMGKGIVEFKRGMRGLEDEMNVSSSSPSSHSSRSTTSQPRRRPDPVDEDREEEWTAPRFEPPTSEPVAASKTQE